MRNGSALIRIVWNRFLFACRNHYADNGASPTESFRRPRWIVSTKELVEEDR